MSLTGTPLIASLAMLAVIAVIAAVVVAPGAKGVPGRLGLLIGCQLCVVLALLAAANSYFLFYSSWNEVTGAVAPPAQAAAAPPKIGRSFERRPEDGFVQANQPPAEEGRLESIVVHGRISGITAPAYVYLPPEYRSDPARRFPVVVALTGYPGDARNLITRLKLPQAVAAARSEIQPMIVVMMRPTVAPPRDTECTDVPGGPQAETFFAQDLPTAAAEAYRTAPQPDGWAMMGDSTGGYCATKLTMRHSTRYTAAVSLSGYYHALKDFTTGDLYGGSRAFRQEHDLLWRLKNRPHPPVSVLVTSSRVGEPDYKDTMRFVSMAVPPMRVSSIILPSGGHHFRVWRQELPASLRWLSARLKA